LVFVPVKGIIVLFFIVVNLGFCKKPLTFLNFPQLLFSSSEPFKSNATGKGTASGKGEGCEVFAKAFAFFRDHREAFLTHYHKRSNAETVFSMIKAKFGDAIRSKTPVAQVNEGLCKVLCHNLCVLIGAMFELGIDPEFAGK
jgi:hypothetical protein